MVASPSINTTNNTGMNIAATTAQQKQQQQHFYTNNNNNNKQYSPTKSSSAQFYSTSTFTMNNTATTSNVNQNSTNNSSSIPITLPSTPYNNNNQQQLSCSYPPQTSTNCPSFHNSQSNISSMRSSPDQCSSPTYHSTMYHNNQPQSSFQACNNNNTCCTLDACCDNHHHQHAQPFTVSSWQVDETCSSSRIPGKIRSRCDPKCFFHWKNQKLTVDDNLLYPLSTNVSSPPLYHVECKKISKKPHHHSFNHHHNQHKSSNSCKITFDDSLSYPPHHKSNVNTQSMFEFVPFKLESLPKDYSLSYMTNVPKRKANFYASQATGHQTSLSELRNRLNEETDLKTQHETTFTLPIQSVNNDIINSSLQQKELSPKGSRTRIFSIKELLN